MRFDSPAEQNPIDALRVVGKPVDRIEGARKTTGTATYAYEWTDIPNVAYGYVIGASIPKGRIVAIDTTDASRSAGVLSIVTAENAGPLGKGRYNNARLLGGPDVQHYHQAVAVVVAETLEQARAGALLVKIRYSAARGAFDLAAAVNTAVAPRTGATSSASGDFSTGFAVSPIQLDAVYTTPDQSHAMMEPHATIAVWNADKLTVWTSTQMVDWARSDLAQTLGIPKENVRLISPFTGGGFGGKLFLRSDAVLAALASRAAKRPVKLALPRPLIANNTTHRPATIQRIRIGTTHAGKIIAIGHESWSGDVDAAKPENAVQQTRLMYSGEHRMTSLKVAALDLAEGNAMRAPGEAPGLMALEVAMDEVAEKLSMDPVSFRILNDTHVDPEHPERRFSSRRLIECLRTGAERFGWNARPVKPGSRREGNTFIGMGVAAAFRNNQVRNSGARVRLDHRGVITVETDMTDIGTGSYTIIAQTAAEMLGVSLDRVTVHLGESDFPVSSGSGGQFGANSSTAGVYAACMKLRNAIVQKAGFDAKDAHFAHNSVTALGRTRTLASLAGNDGITAEDVIEFGDLAQRFQQSTFGAHFVEVAVDVHTYEIRVRRMLAVCAAGRILNPKTARSQVIGAMTMGVGGALMEELAVDKKRGFFVNHDLAGYEVPVHADIGHQEVIFLDEVDEYSSPMKAKGVGELGLCGVAAAIANAVYNATGARIRDYPITLDKLLAAKGIGEA
ncbi:aldehyde oxidoreductase molybdenum-binding subunit PaoC [Cupriavidus plantarum]|uniref:aldehyde oxidoreductase molybdenum-binding subunit PaoC n=1 Tax=Cupriavidus plantarum TaxID=942865 RepID=UPI0015C818FC|nr:aldehyde oxidoreductase molybdenum-binding subunit PaoC [Cupriavidus plantarum]NYI02746.1 xanthine dehydrogenase YagR molybdenum-binding subunit [Cupriavidus plantarum]